VGLPTSPFGGALRQGSEIFLGTTYPNGKNIPKDHKIYQIEKKPNGSKCYKMTNIFYSKVLQNIPTGAFLMLTVGNRALRPVFNFTPRGSI
jgi:hypothetical protein